MKLSQDLGKILRLPVGRVAWDVFLLYKSGVLWDLEPPLPNYWQHQLDVLQGDEFDIPKLEYQLLNYLGPGRPANR